MAAGSRRCEQSYRPADDVEANLFEAEAAQAFRQFGEDPQVPVFSGARNCQLSPPVSGTALILVEVAVTPDFFQTVCPLRDRIDGGNHRLVQQSERPRVAVLEVFEMLEHGRGIRVDWPRLD